MLNGICDRLVRILADGNLMERIVAEQACQHDGVEGCGPEVRVRRVALSTLKPGQRGVVGGSELPEDEAALLRAMGLRDHAEVVLCRMGEPCIVRVMGGCGCSSRIGLSRPLAERVFVDVRPTTPA